MTKNAPNMVYATAAPRSDLPTSAGGLMSPDVGDSQIARGEAAVCNMLSSKELPRICAAEGHHRTLERVVRSLE